MDKNKRIIISSFTNSMNDFIGDLKTAFPKEKYLWSYHTFFELGMKGNPVGVMKKFIEYVFPFKQHIETGNDEFFLDFDKDNNKFEIASNYVDDGLKLKELWVNPSTTDHTKACIIAHLQKILKICDKFNSYN